MTKPPHTELNSSPVDSIYDIYIFKQPQITCNSNHLSLVLMSHFVQSAKRKTCKDCSEMMTDFDEGFVLIHLK